MRIFVTRAVGLLDEMLKIKTKIFIKVQGDISEPNHLRCAKELTAPTDPRQLAWGLNRGALKKN